MPERRRFCVLNGRMLNVARAGWEGVRLACHPGNVAKIMMRSISVIIPVYNESDNLDAMYQALAAIAATESSLEWEFLFVEDGSTDGTFSVLTELNQADPRVKIVQLSRNYGYHVAAAAGLQFASGDAAVIIAGDLQDHPREIRRFLS